MSRCRARIGNQPIRHFPAVPLRIFVQFDLLNHRQPSGKFEYHVSERRHGHEHGQREILHCGGVHERSPFTDLIGERREFHDPSAQRRAPLLREELIIHNGRQ